MVWGLSVHTLTVQVVNLFLSQEELYADESTWRRMAALGFHQQNEIWATELCLAVLVYLTKDWYFWDSAFRPG